MFNPIERGTLNGPFDPEQFLNTQTEGANSTDYILPPPGEYVSIVGERIAARNITTKNGEQVVVDIPYELQSPDISGITHKKQNFAKKSVFLDMTSEGTLDMAPGANVELGRVRAAAHQNDPGRPWAFKMLVGTAARVNVVHRTDAATGRIFADVREVAPL